MTKKKESIRVTTQENKDQSIEEIINKQSSWIVFQSNYDLFLKDERGNIFNISQQRQNFLKIISQSIKAINIMRQNQACKIKKKIGYYLENIDLITYDETIENLLSLMTELILPSSEFEIKVQNPLLQNSKTDIVQLNCSSVSFCNEIDYNRSEDKYGDWMEENQKIKQVLDKQNIQLLYADSVTIRYACELYGCICKKECIYNECENHWDEPNLQEIPVEIKLEKIKYNQLYLYRNKKDKIQNYDLDIKLYLNNSIKYLELKNIQGSLTLCREGSYISTLNIVKSILIDNINGYENISQIKMNLNEYFKGDLISEKAFNSHIIFYFQNFTLTQAEKLFIHFIDKKNQKQFQITAFNKLISHYLHFSPIQTIQDLYFDNDEPNTFINID